MNLRRKIWKSVLTLLILFSVVFNILTIFDWIIQPEYKLGILTQDIDLTVNGIKTLFKLPKGLTVENASPRGIATAGLFFPHRFRIIVAASDEKFVDYSSNNTKSPYRALYKVR